MRLHTMFVSLCAVALVVMVIAAQAPAAPLMQDFDGGGTAYTAVQHNTAPGPAVTGGGPTGSFLRLANDGTNNQQNSIAFDATHPGPFDVVDLKFDFRMGGNDDGADGLSVVLLDTATYGTTGGLTSFITEEPNIPDVFGIGIDTHDNGGVDLSQDSVSLHWDNAKVGEVDLTGTMDLENNLFNRARLFIKPVAGGSEVTLSFIDDVFGTPTVVPVFSDFFILGMNPYESRLSFGARTGGLNDNHDLDNIMANFAIPEPMTASLGLMGLGGLAMSLRRRRA